jgi:hypothetical protein
MLAVSPAKQPLAGILDNFIDSVTGRAVSSATTAAQPLLDDVERRVKALILPVVFFTAGSFLIGLLTYREVAKRSKPVAGLRGRR